ncbi:MAG: histidine phosphatase family protein [Candidatus Levybacteria bacterium]|nr:histidine phosphatase family protein [Candidatus Levybacteria bacterium]
MLNFYFVRHGIKENVPFDPPLTKMGAKQAELTGKRLKDIPFKGIIASHKLRTQQTAKIIAKHLKLPVLADSRLQERLEWEKDMAFDEFATEWNKTDIDRDYKPKNGVSSHGKGRQVKKVVDELLKIHGDGNVLIVAHGGSIGDLLRNLFAQEKLPHKANSISGAKYIGIHECSVTIVQMLGDKYKLLKLADISHLSAIKSKID